MPTWPSVIGLKSSFVLVSVLYIFKDIFVVGLLVVIFFMALCFHVTVVSAPAGFACTFQQSVTNENSNKICAKILSYAARATEKLICGVSFH
jgi:hypothetical protein